MESIGKFSGSYSPRLTLLCHQSAAIRTVGDRFLTPSPAQVSFSSCMRSISACVITIKFVGCHEGPTASHIAIEPLTLPKASTTIRLSSHKLASRSSRRRFRYQVSPLIYPFLDSADNPKNRIQKCIHHCRKRYPTTLPKSRPHDTIPARNTASCSLPEYRPTSNQTPGHQLPGQR